MPGWGTAIGAVVGGLGGALSKSGDDKLHEQATKVRYSGLPLLGLNDWGGMYREITDGTFNPNDPKWKDNPYADIAARGGIGGIRKDYASQFLENIKQGYKGAAGAMQGVARQGRQGVLRERTQGMADVRQSMQDAGLQSSNIAQQARANVSYNTSKSLGEIDTQLSSMLQELKLGQAQATDAALARNYSMEERTNQELMNFLVGGAGFGPGASSGGGPGYMPTGGVDLQSAGAGAAGLFDIFSGLLNKGGG